MSDELERDTPAGGTEQAMPHDQGAAKPVTRRLALKVIGSVPVAGAMLSSSAFAQQGTPSGAQQPKQTHEAPSQPARGQGTPPSSAPKRSFFTAVEWRTVGVLANDIIPRDARSGSATDAGVPQFIDYHLSVPETSEDTRVAIRGGLAWLNTESRKRFRRTYAALSPPQHSPGVSAFAIGVPSGALTCRFPGSCPLACPRKSWKIYFVRSIGSARLATARRAASASDWLSPSVR